MTEQRLQEIEGLSNNPECYDMSCETAELIDAVRDLQAKLTAAALDTVNYRRAKELLESCRAQSVSLMHQRDDALAETNRLRERLHLVLQIDAELKRQP